MIKASSVANVMGSKSVNKNEEFKMVRNVSFSHEQVREYEVTLGEYVVSIHTRFVFMQTLHPSMFLHLPI